MKSELAVQSCYMFFTRQTGGGSGVELGNELCIGLLISILLLF